MPHFGISNASNAKVELKIHLTYATSMPERKDIVISAITAALGIATGLGSSPLIELFTGALQTLGREPDILISTPENSRLLTSEQARGRLRFMTGESRIEDAIDRAIRERAQYDAIRIQR